MATGDPLLTVDGFPRCFSNGVPVVENPDGCFECPCCDVTYSNMEAVISGMTIAEGCFFYSGYYWQWTTPPTFNGTFCLEHACNGVTSYWPSGITTADPKCVWIVEMDGVLVQYDVDGDPCEGTVLRTLTKWFLVLYLGNPFYGPHTWTFNLRGTAEPLDGFFFDAFWDQQAQSSDCSMIPDFTNQFTSAPAYGGSATITPGGC